MSDETITSIFRRLESSYEESPSLRDWILADHSNPLNQISRIIDAGEVLDIGCGSGILGRLLADKPNVIIDGIDPAMSSGTPGLKGYRQFFSHGVEKLFEGQGIERYDWFVMADVIEHFAYPDEVLVALVARAKPGARFLLSTPNVAHLSVRLNLLQGRFDYVDSGILESTHLRFFTLPTFANVLRSAGLHIERVLLLNRVPSSNDLIEFGWFRSLLALAAAGQDDALYTYQFLAIAIVGAGTESFSVEQIGARGASQCYSEMFRFLMSKVKRGARRLI